MCTQLLKCGSLRACDEYFFTRLKDGFLGDLEPQAGEVEHLAAIVARELKEKQTDIKGTLSVAVFLTWMGFLYYEEGNYWGPVYQKLGLPQEQPQWQGILGEIFLRAVEEYRLDKFQGEMRYVIPILAHGYIPNWYLDVYFATVLLPFYTQREEKGLRLQWGDTEHAVLSWRREYSEYSKYRAQVQELENKENELRHIYTAYEYKELLLRLLGLQRELIKGETIEELLSLPGDWLEREERRRLRVKKHCAYLRNRAKEYRRAAAGLKNKEEELLALEQRIEETAEEIFALWKEDFAGLLLHISMEEISALALEGRGPRGLLSQIVNYLLRFFAPAKFKRRLKVKKQIEELLSPLPVKQDLLTNPWPILPNALERLQNLIKQHRVVALGRAEIEATLGEIAVGSGEGMEGLQIELDDSTQKIGAYKTRLVELGKGDIEKGKAILAEQRELRRKVELLEAQCPPDAPNFFPYLLKLGEYPNKDSLQNMILKVKKEKEKALAKGKAFSNPLYQLNESTRAFIFQGGEKAVQFIHGSLLLFDAICKDRPLVWPSLPGRVRVHMADWWKREGKALYETVWRGKERELRERTAAIVRQPVLKFDPEAAEIKVFLPSQPVTQKAKAKFYVKDGDSKKQEVDLPLHKDKDTGILRSEELTLLLKYPQPNYNFYFVAGADNRSWHVNGLGQDNLYLFFDKQGNFIEDGMLSWDGIYLIAPRGTSTEPESLMGEELRAYWAGYDYRYIDLENTDLLVVKKRCASWYSHL